MRLSLPKFRQQIGGFISVSNEQKTANIIALLCTPNDNAVISLLRDKCRMVSWRPNKSLSSFPWTYKLFKSVLYCSILWSQN